jgi:hypothetical protein
LEQTRERLLFFGSLSSFGVG